MPLIAFAGEVGSGPGACPWSELSDQGFFCCLERR